MGATAAIATFIAGTSSGDFPPESDEKAKKTIADSFAAIVAAIGSIAAKMGCTAETLRRWVRQAERDQGRRAGLSMTERDRLKELERDRALEPEIRRVYE